MKDFHFFAAMPEDRKSKARTKAAPAWTRATVRELAAAGKHADCVAVYTDRSLWFVSHGEVMREAVAGVYSQDNSPVCSTSVGAGWLRSRCVRIDEPTARKLHPALFEYLDR